MLRDAARDELLKAVHSISLLVYLSTYLRTSLQCSNLYSLQIIDVLVTISLSSQISSVAVYSLQIIDEAGIPKDPEHRMLKQLPAMLNQLEWMAVAMRTQRECCGLWQ